MLPNTSSSYYVHRFNRPDCNVGPFSLIDAYKVREMLVSETNRLYEVKDLDQLHEALIDMGFGATPPNPA